MTTYYGAEFVSHMTQSLDILWSYLADCTLSIRVESLHQGRVSPSGSSLSIRVESLHQGRLSPSGSNIPNNVQKFQTHGINQRDLIILALKSLMNDTALSCVLNMMLNCYLFYALIDIFIS